MPLSKTKEYKYYQAVFRVLRYLYHYNIAYIFEYTLSDDIFNLQPSGYSASYHILPSPLGVPNSVFYRPAKD
jgi:hypothetical protein